MKKSRANKSDSDDSLSDLELKKDESEVIVEEVMYVVDEGVGEDSDDDHSTITRIKMTTTLCC